MKSHETELPPKAIALIQKGALLEAIKTVRERTGMSLTDAKAAVDAYVRDPTGAHFEGTTAPLNNPIDVPLQAIQSLEKGRLIDAIKHTRKAHGLDLKDTKEFVEHYLERNPALQARYKVASTIERKRIVTKLATILAIAGAAVLVLLYALDNGP